jgi:PPOX class probable F420-dependent enzyme
MTEMTRDEIIAFLAQGTLTAKVATARKDGACHVVPVWFVLDGDDIVFTTSADSTKAKHLARDNRIAVCVDDQKPPFSFASIFGTASLTSHEPSELLKWTSKIAERYMGKENAEAYGKRNAVEGELLVRVKPERIIAEKDVAGW